MKKLLLILIFFLIPTISFSAEDKVKLLIPDYEVKKESKKSYYRDLNSEKNKGKQNYKKINLDDFVKKFEKSKYKVDQIEIWVEGVTSSGGVTDLIISSEDKGGIKVTLKLKQ